MKVEIFEVECFECDKVFSVPQDQIGIDLDEGYSEDDFWWIHRYFTDCPQCGVYRQVDILTDSDCCFDPSAELRYKEIPGY